MPPANEDIVGPPPAYDFTFQQHHPVPPQKPYTPPPGPASPRPSQPIIARQFPPTFNLYSVSHWSGTYSLGEHQNTPLYAVSTHTGWSGQPDIVLHNGPNTNCPVLASYDQPSWGRSATATLPPLGTGSAAGVEETVKATGHAHPVRSFMVEVNDPSGKGLRRETFEWRNSKGEAVASLGGRSRGRKLVRLAQDAAPGGGPSASGGGEVVAVCTHSVWTGKKLFEFEFVGSGAQGGLGERWAVMAVVTALGLWDRDRKQQQSSAAGSSSG